MSTWWCLVFVFALTVAGTFFSRRWALRSGLLDVPNARSAHSSPIPRGGGIAVVLSVSLVLGFLALQRALDPEFFLAVGAGGFAVAIVGYVDDRHQLSPLVRLAVHTAAAIWAVWWLGGLSAVQFGERVVDLGWFGDVLGVVGIVWALNLFNFMDGIDGIAATEAGFVCLAGALLAGSVGALDQSLAAAVVGAGALGFLVWNWPPARIFMGDVGSGYLGYVIGVFAVAQSHAHPASLWVWLILGGVFVVDATITFLRRLARGERVYEAHRTHAYQWLARRWRSHAHVTLSVVAVNVFWLLPCAWLATIYPQAAGWLLLAGLAPIALAAIVIGAGRDEAAARS